MNNVVSVCYVIESDDYSVEPIIYLRKPTINPFNESLITFLTPFAAKKFIKTLLGPDAPVMVTYETTSQLLLMVK
jgi:hypothetical protein